MLMVDARVGDSDATSASVMRSADLRSAAATHYELAIVGGGIYGLMLALEAARRGVRVILVERSRFGAATSRQSLRIIHGGLRYLQQLDLRRFRESVAERRWYLRTFPKHVRPLSCLMPLYGRGLRSPAVLRAALAVNDALSFRRNAGVRGDRRIPGGRLLEPTDTLRCFPDVEMRGLRGGALWSDAVLLDPDAMIADVISEAVALGAALFERVEALAVHESAGRVETLELEDRKSGDRFAIPVGAVANCAGPWCRVVAARLDRDVPELFHPSLAFNLLLRRPLTSTAAVAVTPRKPGSRTYFAHSHEGTTLAGTYHAPWTGGPEPIQVDEKLIGAMLGDLNAAVPDWNLSPNDVIAVYAGLLPVTRPGTVDLLRRPVIYDHGAQGGIRGVYSVSGVKLTTAHRVADRVLNAIFPGRIASGRGV